MNDDEIRNIGMTDQSAAAFSSMAMMIAAFFKKLVDEGLTREEALSLASDVAITMFTEQFKRNEG